jgi:hypothetical protein
MANLRRENPAHLRGSGGCAGRGWIVVFGSRLQLVEAFTPLPGSAQPSPPRLMFCIAVHQYNIYPGRRYRLHLRTKIFLEIRPLPTQKLLALQRGRFPEYLHTRLPISVPVAAITLIFVRFSEWKHPTAFEATGCCGHSLGRSVSDVLSRPGPWSWDQPMDMFATSTSAQL